MFVFIYLFFFLCVFLEIWSPSADENLLFLIFSQKIFPTEVMLNQKKPLKCILEKGVSISLLDFVEILRLFISTYLKSRKVIGKYK